MPPPRFSMTRPGGGRFDAPSSGFQISRQTFIEIEQFIEDNIASAAKFHYGMDVLVQFIAYSIRERARYYARGPVSPLYARSVSMLANRIPVQRITGAYYAGWALRRRANAYWSVYNDSKEAWLIETGLYQRRRRPILKMATLDMLRMVQTTRTGDRFVDWALKPRRNAKGHFQSFDVRSRNASMALTAPDLVARGRRNPYIVGPSRRLPR